MSRFFNALEPPFTCQQEKYDTSTSLIIEMRRTTKKSVAILGGTLPIIPETDWSFFTIKMSWIKLSQDLSHLLQFSSPSTMYICGTFCIITIIVKYVQGTTTYGL